VQQLGRLLPLCCALSNHGRNLGMHFDAVKIFLDDSAGPI
jgi:hypothetical protein